MHSVARMSQPYFDFFIRALTLVNLWPRPSAANILQRNCVTAFVAFATVPVAADLISCFYDDNLSLSRSVEYFVALSALYAVVYIGICFANRRHQIKTLIEDLRVFETFTPKSLIADTDNAVTFYTKIFIIYGIVGNICYTLLPWLVEYTNCEKNKSPHMIKFGVPCGLIIPLRLPFRYDYFPLAQLASLWEYITCTLGGTVIILITMLICGILTHITVQLQWLKNNILQLSKIQETNLLQKKVQFCVRFHIEILNYAKRANLCFNQMMLLHITWTSLVIAVLGFEIVTTANYAQSVRFLMHLLGWLVMLFVVCYHGQILMDHSLAIAEAIYSFSWYEKNVKVQKYVVLILLRSQKPLTLNACGLQVMSYATFLEVLYSAYSYITLLLKFN